jgi:hypothetical protein
MKTSHYLGCHITTSGCHGTTSDVTSCRQPAAPTRSLPQPRRCFGVVRLSADAHDARRRGRLAAAGKIDGEFLASDRWQVERKRRIVNSCKHQFAM